MILRCRDSSNLLDVFDATLFKIHITYKTLLILRCWNSSNLLDVFDATLFKIHVTYKTLLVLCCWNSSNLLDEFDATLFKIHVTYKTLLMMMMMMMMMMLCSDGVVPRHPSVVLWLVANLTHAALIMHAVIRNAHCASPGLSTSKRRRRTCKAKGSVHNAMTQLVSNNLEVL